MEYIELTVSTSTEGTEIVSEVFMKLGATGTQIIDRNDVPDEDKPKNNWELIDKTVKENMPQAPEVKAWFEKDDTLFEKISLLKQNLSALLSQDTEAMLGTLSLNETEVQQTDWSENWKKYYKPFRAGKHLVIKPTWEKFDKKEDDLIIEIDPGMAFGTGTHETTKMCIELIEKYYTAGNILDIGTGSGILAIAAAKLGAKDITAVDIDKDAVQVAIENVALNHLSDTIVVKEGDLVQGIDQTFDFAVANILAPIIIMLLNPLKKHLKKDALFICSGIINDKEQDVLDALEREHYKVLEVLRMGDWTAIVSRI